MEFKTRVCENVSENSCVRKEQIFCIWSLHALFTKRLIMTGIFLVHVIFK